MNTARFQSRHYAHPRRRGRGMTFGGGRLVGKVALDPSEGHDLLVGGEGAALEVRMTPAQVEDLEDIIRSYKARCAFVDGGPDLQFSRVEALE